MVAVWVTASPADVGAAARAPAGPELTAGPSTDLVDGQEVTITGTGFGPRRTIDVYQCAADLVGLVDCDLGTKHQVTVAGDGSVSTRMPVHAVIDSWARRGVDCREPGTCVLATEISFQHVGAAVTVPISFTPDATEHLPTVTVSPGGGLIDRQSVTVEGEGFVRSERPLVRIYQCAPVPDLGAEICDVNPRQTAELDEEGHFTASLAVSTTLVRDGWDQRIDCRTAGACFLRIVAAGLAETARTVVRAPLVFDPDAEIPDWPPPQITVTPTTDLDDVQSVTVQGSGFGPGSDIQFLQCPADEAHDPELCFRVFDRAAADPQGTFDSDVVVQALRYDANCREAPGCVLVVRSQELEQAIPLSFGDPEPGVRYLDPVFDEVDVIRDIVYRETVDAYGNPVELKLDIYVPRGDAATRRPATIWMHGGFFQAGDKSEMEAFAIASARRGQVGVSMQYRLRPDAVGDWREMYLASLDAYDDATAGVEWLREHADDYGIDPRAVIAGGYSAGAVTALNLAYLPGQRGPATSLVAAAIPDAGLLYSAPERGEPPAIAFHHREDPILPYDSIATLCPQATAVDVPCELHSFENWGHGTTVEVVFLHSTPFVAEHVLEPLGYFDVTADAGGPYEVDEGHDRIFGGAGDDSLHRARGDDELAGGPGGVVRRRDG